MKDILRKAWDWTKVAVSTGWRWIKAAWQFIHDFVAWIKARGSKNA